MLLNRRAALQGGLALSAFGTLFLTGCTSDDTTSSSSSSTTSGSLAMSGKTWKYDSTNDVYYQLGKQYVAKPQATAYENLTVYVPGKYFTGTKNSDGTYTTKVNASGTVAGFTASTAPIVFPVNTPGYAAQKPPTSYSYNDVSAYMKAGFVYVAAGMRGKDSNSSSYAGNAPWGVTDLKSAIRYVRYNASVIPGSTDRIFTFGMSGGGAQSAIAGTSGDSTLYTPYLTAIGAAMKDSSGKSISDAVAGAMCWCPITSLDTANGAYEWNMGQFASSGTRKSGTWTKQYSTDLAIAYAGFINKLGLKDASGTALTLSKSSSGTFLSGSYYDYVVGVINTSLNRFLSYTTFPYTATSSMGAAGGAPTGTAPGGTASAGSSSSGAPSGTMTGAPTGTSSSSATTPNATSSASTGSSSGTTYKTVAAYIAHLNSDSTWVTYDASTKKATVLNLEGFVTSQKTATKDVGAFDGIARGEGENVVFGHGTGALHFEPFSKQVISANQSTYAKASDWKAAYSAAQYTSDLAKTDSVGKVQGYRANMYNPMYFVSPAYGGSKTSTVAKHWRIRTGIQQGDTANTVEINLALALQTLGKSVDFHTVWGQAHVEAEENGTGNADANFISWVKSSLS